jgi:hypothetical protein
MKNHNKKLDLLFLLLSIPGLSNAQQFIDTSKAWSITECTCGGWGVNYTTIFKFTTDTVINGFTYTNLSVFDTTYNFSYDKALLREDTAAKRVYWRVANQDYLLYDFNLGVGDTIHNVPGPNGFPCGDMVVDSIQFNNFYGITRKQWYFTDPNTMAQETWVDGIGNLAGVIHNHLDCTVDYNAILLCYSESGNTLYYNNIYNTCYYSTLDAGNLIHTDAGFSIYPNPSVGSFYIDTRNTLRKTITIRNMLGEVLSEQTTAKIFVKCDISKQGIYTVTVNDGHNKTGLLIIK